MYFKHKIFGAIFNFFTIFPLNNNKISFITDSNNSFNGNLDFINKELDNSGNYQYNYFFKDKFSIKSLYNLATSKYIFLNDNFFPLAFMNIKKNVKVSQLWHAPGAFKKFGASVSNDSSEKEIIKKISNNTNYLFTSSDKIKNFYKEAFLIDEDKIMPLGTPRIDYYFKNDLNLDSFKNDFLNKYPEAKGKKIVLYAPTFRDEEKFNNVFDYLDLNKFNEELSNEYFFILRLHPKISKFADLNFSNKNFLDLTDFENEQELLLISDILITDYSSIMIEFAILNKPIIFFAYDLDYYLSNDRGFYFDYEKNVPGVIVKNTDDLIETIKNNKFKNSKNQDFLNYQFNHLDDKSSSRIINFLLDNEGQND
ncbi:CDP-glycerol glycerophosphotransferase family protein [Methanobrevibacter sp. OttesenSCG-928-K11]|nr:CDP-glycerol glycerophosphotransferase family protein [Methanobrevibacter sp. OttesenSCG-928-K11]